MFGRTLELLYKLIFQSLRGARLAFMTIKALLDGFTLTSILRVKESDVTSHTQLIFGPWRRGKVSQIGSNLHELTSRGGAS
jgi:hypothetical protein